MDRNEIEERMEKLADRLYYSHGKPSKTEKEEIISELDLLLSVEPDNEQALLLKASLYALYDEYDDAIMMYEKALEKNPDDKDIKDSIRLLKENQAFNSIRTKPLAEEYQSESKIVKMLKSLSIWHVVLIKLIILAIIMYVFFMPLFNK